MIALDALGPAHDDVAVLTTELRDRGAEVLVTGSAKGADVALPADMPKTLGAPAGLSKVTAT